MPWLSVGSLFSPAGRRAGGREKLLSHVAPLGQGSAASTVSFWFGHSQAEWW